MNHPSRSTAIMATTLWALLMLILGPPAEANASAPPRAEKASAAPINKTWTYQKDSAHGRNPLTITLQVTGAAADAPFLRTVTVTDADGATLFRAEHDDSGIDQFFGGDGESFGCSGYQECKNKWYFEELPQFVENSLEIIDYSDRDVEAWERDILADVAGHYLLDKGMPADRRQRVLEEMQSMLSGRFDNLCVPDEPGAGSPSLMFVPSINSFVPYFHP